MSECPDLRITDLIWKVLFGKNLQTDLQLWSPWKMVLQSNAFYPMHTTLLRFLRINIFFVNPFINFFVGPSHKILLKFVVVIRQTVEVWILQALQLPVPTYSLRFWSGLGEAQFVRFVFPRVFRPVAVIKYQIQLENDEVQSPLRAAEGQINSPKAPLCRSTLDPAVCHYKCVAYVNKCHLSFSL